MRLRRDKCIAQRDLRDSAIPQPAPAVKEEPVSVGVEESGQRFR